LAVLGDGTFSLALHGAARGCWLDSAKWGQYPQAGRRAARCWSTEDGGMRGASRVRCAECN